MQLRDYQIRGKDFILEKEKCYLAIDMGLGKTAICLHTVAHLSLPTLIIAPLKVAYNTWPDEVRDWDLDSDLDVKVLHGNNKDELFKQRAQGTLCHVINYDGIPWLYKTLFRIFQKGGKLPYKFLILDESTFIKDPQSNRFGYLCAMRDMFKYIVNLSGTPSPQSLADLWSQYYILDKGASLGADYRPFKTKYFSKDPHRKYKWNLKPFSKDAIHQLIDPITFRLQSEDYIDLPERIYNTIKLELSDFQRKQYEKFKKDFILSLEEADVKSLNAASLSSKLRQYIQGAIYENLDNGGRKTHYLHDLKVNALEELIEINKGKSFICFVQFQFEINLIQKQFPNAPHITGLTNDSESNRLIKLWNEGKIPLLIAHPRSIGRGLNLQSGGHNILWFALPYSLDDYLQGNKRVHRPGQINTVVIHHLVVKNTIDETVVNVLNSKDATQQDLLNHLKEVTDQWLKSGINDS